MTGTSTEGGTKHLEPEEELLQRWKDQKEEEDRESELEPLFKPFVYRKTRGTDGYAPAIQFPNGVSKKKMNERILWLTALFSIAFLSDMSIPRDCKQDNVEQERHTMATSFDNSSYIPPEPLAIPSVERPLILFHQRKTGGSGIRAILNQAAQALSPKAITYIPCESILNDDTKLHCETYYTPQIAGAYNAEPPTIYGGHFFFPGFLKTLHLFHNQPSHKYEALIRPNPIAKFTCLTMFREPIARIQSCWNYRLVQDTKQEAREAQNVTKFSELWPPEKMTSYLGTALSQYGEGCLNEPMRLFSDYGANEGIVNHLHEPRYEYIAQHATEQTITRVAEHCVVGILERCQDTKAAIAKYLPFLQSFFLCDDKKFKDENTTATTSKANEGTVSKSQLNEQQMEAVKSVAKYEYQVYEHANKILDAQIGI